MGGRRRFRARLARVLVVALVLGCISGSASAAPGDDVEAAQERANRAAAELAEAQEAIALAQDAVTTVETRVATVEARVGAAREQVRELAIRLYVGGAAPVLRILSLADANEVIRAQQYSRVVVGASMDALEDYRTEREELRRELDALEREQDSHAESVEDHRARQADAIEELDRLTEVLAEETARQEAARRATATAGTSAESSAAGQSTSGPLAATPSPSPASPIPSTPTSAPTAAPTSAPPGTAPPEPAPGPDDDPAPSEWLCPVQGAHAFSDDYGAPRGGGFSHQGNDILAARGTPVVASVDGVVRHRQGAVSGLAYYLDGDDGNEYFGAHLDSFGASGRVTQGTVVGRVGNTGDAASTAPHLHFEIHPGGSGYENPYPTLVKYC
jgi:peptidoglycan LD-endopeptidase LytH